MKQKCIIRPAEISDLEEMKQVIQIAMDQYSLISHIPPLAPLDALKETVKDLRKYVLSDYFLLAIYEEKIVGTIRISEVTNDEAYISRFAVLPSMQKLGVGSVIFEAAVNYIIKKGYQKVTLHTALKNAPLVRFYTRHDFVLFETNTDRGYARGKFVKYISTL